MIKGIIKFVGQLLMDGPFALIHFCSGWLGAVVIFAITAGRVVRDSDDWFARLVGLALGIAALLHMDLQPVSHIASP